MNPVKPVVRRDEIVERQSKVHAGAVAAAVERFNQAALNSPALPFTVPVTLLGDLIIVMKVVLRISTDHSVRMTLGR